MGGRSDSTASDRAATSPGRRRRGLENVPGMGQWPRTAADPAAVDSIVRLRTPHAPLDTSSGIPRRPRPRRALAGGASRAGDEVWPRDADVRAGAVRRLFVHRRRNIRQERGDQFRGCSLGRGNESLAARVPRDRPLRARCRPRPGHPGGADPLPPGSAGARADRLLLVGRPEARERLLDERAVPRLCAQDPELPGGLVAAGSGRRARSSRESRHRGGKRAIHAGGADARGGLERDLDVRIALAPCWRGDARVSSRPSARHRARRRHPGGRTRGVLRARLPGRPAALPAAAVQRGAVVGVALMLAMLARVRLGVLPEATFY